MKKLKRTTFATSRLLEFFNEKELDMQLGQSRDYWPIAILKELLDNALDASEKAGPPVIKVDYGKDWVSVEDSGPGMSTELISKALDYTVRVSDKNHYIAPSRGQLGNALKCVWAAPFVWAGDGLVEIESKGVHNRIEIKVDKIAQEPKISHTTDDSLVKKGTFFKIHWPEITSYLEGEKNGFFYKWLSAKVLIKRYSAFNPHATFHFKDEVFESGNREWIKFKADDQTSAYWYSPDELKGLIAAYITNGGKTVREFVSEFRGLSGTGKQKAVLQDTGMSGLQLSQNL